MIESRKNDVLMRNWECPNECEIDHVLVCGGTSSNEEQETAANVYFQMKLDGTYTNLNSDGIPGVSPDAYDHADGGCCNEPICPVCLTESVRTEIGVDE